MTEQRRKMPSAACRIIVAASHDRAVDAEVSSGARADGVDRVPEIASAIPPRA
jgi:hypothetical protein